MIAVSFWATVLAGVLLPWLKLATCEGSPIARIKVFGLPVMTLAGVPFPIGMACECHGGCVGERFPALDLPEPECRVAEILQFGGSSLTRDASNESRAKVQISYLPADYKPPVLIIGIQAYTLLYFLIEQVYRPRGGFSA